MTTEKVQISLVLPRDLWEQLRDQAQTEQKDETTLMTRAIEQFLQQEAARVTMAECL